MTIRVRTASPEEGEALLPLFEFLVGRAPEDAKTPLDETRAMHGFWHIMTKATAVYVAETEDKIVGSLAVTEQPLAWYGRADALGRFDDWFVTDPEHRPVVGRRLMAVAQREAGDIPVIIRRVRGKIGPGTTADIIVVGSVVHLR